MLVTGICNTASSQDLLARQSGSHHTNQPLAPLQEQRISIKVKKEKLVTVLEKIEKQVKYVFVYSNDDINTAQRITLDAKNVELKELMDQLIKQIDAQYEILSNKIILKNRSGGKLETSSPGHTTHSSYLTETQATAAADLTVSGQVRNQKGEGIEGVSVTLKGSNSGTTSGKEGKYSIDVPENKPNPVLVFSYVGYATLEEPVADRRTVNVFLVQQELTLEDVVVVGYGTQKRVSVTGAVDKINRSALDGKPAVNLSQALQGASPNLIIQQRNFEPGQGVSINIRGLRTLGDNTPLVVIDGIIGGDINLLNPADIESVSVLKDAGSAAIYGSRSANGVILITTRKGQKDSRPRINYSGIYGIQTPRITYKPVHAWENAYYKNESLINSGMQPLFSPEQIRQFAQKGDGDWRLDNILQNAAQQNHTISISGGSATSTYLLSAGYIDQRSNFIGQDFGWRRYSLRLNHTMEYGKFKLSTILSYVKSTGLDHSFNSGFLVVDAGRVPLYYSFQDSAGNYLTNPVSAELNPKAILQKGGYRKYNNDEVFGSFTGEYPITQHLKVRGVFGGTVRANSTFGRRLQIDFIPGGKYGQDREVFDESYKSLLTNVQLLVEYNRDFGDHHINVLAGGTNESFKSESSSIFKTLTDQNLGTPTTGTIIGTNSRNSNQGTTETSINSLLGRAGYSYNEKYFFEFSFRYDGSSNFAKNGRWGFFPSVGASWKLTDEPFLAIIKQKFGDLKLRTTYGLLGSQNVGAYQYQTSFFNYPNAYGFNNTVVGGAGYSLGNPGLTWEKSANFNVGLDASLLRNRLEVSLDYFDKTTSDILVPRKDVPLIFGAGFPDFNTAKVNNKGWEIRVNYTIPGRLIRQTIGFNLADNYNELKSFTFGANELVERKEEFEFVRRVGQPITVYQGYKRAGYFQNLKDIQTAPIFAGQNRGSLSPGDIRFVDRNNDGVIDDNDKFILGNPFPRYTFGFTYSANIKGFDIVIFVQGVGKRDAMIRGELVEPFHFGYGGTMYVHQTDYWTPTNPNAKYPRLAEAGSASNTNNYRTGSDIYLFNAAYARLKNLQIGYSIPSKVLQKAKIQKARIYFTGQNLLTLSKLNFLDPEITEFDNNTSFNTGANSARAYPLPVFFGMGLDITF